MVVRRKRVGKGFSAQLVLGPETSSWDATDFLDTLRAHQDAELWTLGGRLRDIEQRVDELRNAKVDQHGRAVSAYASEALAYVKLIREEISVGNGEAAALASLRLGSLWRELELKLEFEKAALGPSRGGKASAANKWPGEATKAKRAQVNSAVDAARTMGLSKMESYRRVARDLKIPERTVRRLYASGKS